MSEPLLLLKRLRDRLIFLGIDPSDLDYGSGHSHVNIVNTGPDEDAIFHWEGQHYRIRISVLEQILGEVGTKEEFFKRIEPHWQLVANRPAK